MKCIYCNKLFATEGELLTHGAIYHIQQLLPILVMSLDREQKSLIVDMLKKKDEW